MEIYRSLGNCLNEMRNVSACSEKLKKVHGKNSISCCAFTIQSFIHLMMAFAVLLSLITGLGILSTDSAMAVRSGQLLEPIVKDPKLKVELMAKGLDSPTAMTFLDSNHILVLEKNKGIVRMIRNGTLVQAPLLDVNVSNKYERGMLGILTDFDRARNTTYIYLFFTEDKVRDGRDICTTTSKCINKFEPIANNLYKYELSKSWSRLINPKLILSVPASPGAIHNGGAMIFGPNDTIFLPVGEVETKAIMVNDKDGIAPNGRGGILFFKKNGDAISNIGPLGKGSPLNKYYAYGIRNSFGLDFDPITGKLWDTENGPVFGDELNLVEPGFNSGWAKISGMWENNKYTGGPVLIHPEKYLYDFNGKGKYSKPEFSWKSPIGPTAIKFFNSDKYGKEYENDVFVGSNNNRGILYHFKLDKDRSNFVLKPPLIDNIANNFNETNEIIFGQGFGLIPDIDVGPDGYLYILALGKGSIYRVIPK
jgi:glucose/arabinose dehydrogenase